MTEKQIILVKRSWKVYRSIDPVLVGDVFYSKLFSSAPQLKKLFTSSREEQSKKLVEMLSMIVSQLDELEDLKDEIHQLAIRHKSYGVRFSHYDQVGSALLWTLEKGLGNDWNEEVKEAWATCYQTISASMQASLV